MKEDLKVRLETILADARKSIVVEGLNCQFNGRGKILLLQEIGNWSPATICRMTTLVREQAQDMRNRAITMLTGTVVERKDNDFWKEADSLQEDLAKVELATVLEEPSGKVILKFNGLGDVTDLQAEGIWSLTQVTKCLGAVWKQSWELKKHYSDELARRMEDK